MPNSTPNDFALTKHVMRKDANVVALITNLRRVHIQVAPRTYRSYSANFGIFVRTRDIPSLATHTHPHAWAKHRV